MNLETWLAFLAASAAVLIIPGPTILLVLGQSVGGDRRSTFPLVAGVAAGDALAMSLSLAGLGALLAASSLAFTVLKWAGAAYLLWLGFRMWRAPVEGAQPPAPPRRAGLQAFLVTATNPKSIAFFVAFVPQFLDPARPFLPQAGLLVGSFVILGAGNSLGYALLAGRLSSAIRRPGTRRILNRAGGSMLIGAGLATALLGRRA
ncbi:LysE family translocator [Roseomonas xinghualingensis]|uniref:LysE family translocator n=1 Tax=Roseomonas xinghualingensis TaxID=2986475 RepID=UPI0021F1A707|nr:LysE family translocator [Roseomonas sp. SXEYE001]MCV4206487.1 LysE family translocator [Roseomonas sp. SXEYE001]